MIEIMKHHQEEIDGYNNNIAYHQNQIDELKKKIDEITKFAVWWAELSEEERDRIMKEHFNLHTFLYNERKMSNLIA